ncbi:MAG TPA: sugar-binding transcriptional regulator [Casimicrobiaceae bacterium]
MSQPSSLMVKVCHYYYRDQLTMAQIGERLSISRHRVGRLLKDAVDTGVVKIEIHSPLNKNTALERALQQRFGLKASLVVDTDAGITAEEVKQLTGKAAGAFLRELLDERFTIGVGWGSTTFELVDQFEPMDLPDATVVQITGGNKRLSVRFDCHEVTRRLAQKLNVDPVLLRAPGIVDKPQTRQLLMQESAIAETFRHYDEIDIAIVGIGSLGAKGQSTLINSGYVSAAELKALQRAGAVGDVFSYFVDARGALVRTELYERLITIGLPQIRKIPTTVGIATGAAKAQAVAAAVRGGFVNTLVVDGALAQALLRLPAEAAAEGANTRKAVQAGSHM